MFIAIHETVKPIQFSLQSTFRFKSSELPVNIKKCPPGANKSAIILAAAFPSTWYLGSQGQQLESTGCFLDKDIEYVFSK